MAHLGNNFTPYLIGGLMDQLGFTPLQMGVWSMVELLAYAVTMLLIAPHLRHFSARHMALMAGLIMGSAQFSSSLFHTFLPLLALRVACGLGFGLANTSLNLAAAQTNNPARALSFGLAIQTALYTLINLGLPIAGKRYGTSGMFDILAGLAILFAMVANSFLPNRSNDFLKHSCVRPQPLTKNGWKVLLAISVFSFGSLAIWPFIERAAHEIGVSAVRYGQYQSVATLACVASNTIFAALAGRLSLRWTLLIALSVCGTACAALTLVSTHLSFAIALIAFNVSWLIAYPLILSIAYKIDADGRLSVLCSSAWILNMAIGSVVTGTIAQWLGSYVLIGPLGLVGCLTALRMLWPLSSEVH
ncbi:MFS transporter [Acetobacter sp.]|uniref:MFS transporter n=1 Tax=Acetobacter sp. TaxID=440 RepID=UPI0039EACDE5